VIVDLLSDCFNGANAPRTTTTILPPSVRLIAGLVGALYTPSFQRTHAFQMDDAMRFLTNRTDTYRESAPVCSILDTIAWWNDVNAVNGGRADQSVRLFAVPEMNHCAGGPSTDQFNACGALVDWAEKGVAPDRIVVTARMSTPWPGRTRLLSVYPKQPRYKGSSGLEDAANFICREN